MFLILKFQCKIKNQASGMIIFTWRRSSEVLLEVEDAAAAVAAGGAERTGELCNIKPEAAVDNLTENVTSTKLKVLFRAS